MKIKKIIYIALGIVGLYAIYFIGGNLIHGNIPNHTMYKNYLFLFRESPVRENARVLPFSMVNRRRNIYTHFLYAVEYDTTFINGARLILPKYAYTFTIWEFMNLEHISLDDVGINTNIDLSGLTLRRGQILNSRSKRAISIRYGPRFRDGMNVNLSPNSQITEYLQGENYKGFIGNLFRISFSNERNQHIIFMNYWGQDVIVLFYIKDGRFFLIMIHCVDGVLPVDEWLLEKLNLE